MDVDTSSDASSSSGASSPRADHGPAAVVPQGYARARLDTDYARDGDLWIVRIPDGVDPTSLDGVTIPLSEAHRSALASVKSGDTTYDLFDARCSDQHADMREKSQLIEMAGGSASAFFESADLQRQASTGIAAELSGMRALLPGNDGMLHLCAIARSQHY